MNKRPRIYIRKAEPGDLIRIHELEQRIEPENPASIEVLASRLSMFQEGFLVAEVNNTVVGYIESLIWQEKSFDAFSQICNFSDHCDLDGNSIYIIFIAVDAKFRRLGIASRLISHIVDIAKSYNLNRVCLVGKGEYINFYKKLGFTIKKDLPEFLPGEDLVPCYMQCKVNEFKIPVYHNDDSAKDKKGIFFTRIQAGLIKAKTKFNSLLSGKFSAVIKL